MIEIPGSPAVCVLGFGRSSRPSICAEESKHNLAHKWKGNQVEAFNHPICPQGIPNFSPHRREEVPHVQAVDLPREVEGDARAGGGAVGARAGQEQGARRGRRLRRGLEVVTG